MLIRLLNNFVHDTYLNQLLQKRSQSRYEHEVQKLRAEVNHQSDAIPERFVIFNFPRSGSNLLCTMLNQHPEILCHQEVFNPLKIYYSKDFHLLFDKDESTIQDDFFDGKAGLGSKRQRDFKPEHFVTQLWRYSYGASAVGFNLFPTHIPNMAPALIRDKEVKKVLLLRRNKVKCYVSRAIARKTNVWDISKKKSRQNTFKTTTQVEVDPNRLLLWSRQYDEYFNSLRQQIGQFNQPFFEVAYEDLVGPLADKIKAELLDFIGVSQQIEALQPLTKKQNPKKISELVVNYAQLRKELLGTELEKFLS